MQGEDDAEDGLLYKARITNSQVKAMGYFLRENDFYRHLGSDKVSKPFKLGATCNVAETKKWLSNAWNTERLLRFQLSMPEEAKQFSVQWAFPQAYYACYCQVLALFSMTGHTETSHSAVLRKFGVLAKQRKFPDPIGSYADGPMNEISLHGVRKTQYPSSSYLELGEPLSIENQIAQLLSSTRKKALKGKKEKMKGVFKTKQGKPKQKLISADWQKVSEKLGPTTILGYLYRKRIKANYQDIDTLLQDEINGDDILSGLVSIVNAFAALCERNIMQVIHSSDRKRLSKHNLAKQEFMKDRMNRVWTLPRRSN